MEIGVNWRLIGLKATVVRQYLKEKELMFVSYSQSSGQTLSLTNGLFVMRVKDIYFQKRMRIYKREWDSKRTKMRILITGSEGKIGKELIKIMFGHELLLVDKKGGESVKCDLSIDDLDFIEEFKPEIIIHLAASFERTDESPIFHRINYADNIKATYRLNSLISSLTYSPYQYIYASSYLVYEPVYLSEKQRFISLMLGEDSLISPRNLIGAAKLYGENEIDFIKRNVHKEMKVTHARIFRVFGEGGQEFVSRVIEWARLGIPIDIWKPENRFDFIHTSDCASAIRTLIGQEGIYNIGSGQNTAIEEIIGLVRPKIRAIDKDDLFESSCADIRKIQELGWEPKVNVLEWVKGKL